MKTSSALAPVLLMALVSVAPRASETIHLRSGETVKGTAASYDAERRVLHFLVDGGSAKESSLDDLDGRSVYLVHASIVERDNGPGQLQLANFARDAGLYRHAARRYGYAVAADPSLASEVEGERAKLRSMAADFCLANAEEARRKGDAGEVEKWAKLLLKELPDEPQARKAAALLEEGYTARRAAEQEELAAEFHEALESDALKAKKAYDKMVEDTRKGLTERNDTRAKRLWEGALKAGEDVLEEIDGLVATYGDDARVLEGARKYRALTVAQLVELHLHLASQATVKSSLKTAMNHVNTALALDPGNRDVLAARARIEHAANQGLINW